MKLLIVCLLVALSISSCLSRCSDNAECGANECCAGTRFDSPNNRICQKFHQFGEQCGQATTMKPCGCAKGLQCLQGKCQKERTGPPCLNGPCNPDECCAASSSGAWCMKLNKLGEFCISGPPCGCETGLKCVKPEGSLWGRCEQKK